MACHILVLFIVAVAVTPGFNLEDESKSLQNALKQLLGSSEQVRFVEHDGHGRHHYDHDSTNLGTMNLVLKHNALPPNLDKSKARTGGVKHDMMCKLGARCGCSKNAARCGCSKNSARCGCSKNSARCGCSKNSGRCGCSRSGESCDSDQDYPSENAATLNTNSDKHNQNVKKYRADPNIVKLLDDLEDTILAQNFGGEDDTLGNTENCKLDETGKCKHDYSSSDQTLSNRVEDHNRNRPHLHCCKKCGGYKALRFDNKAYLRCCQSCSRADNEYSDKSVNNLISKAKIFQINKDYDAIVLDVVDVDNILKLLKNGNIYNNENAIRDYIRTKNIDTSSKSKKSLKLTQELFADKRPRHELFRRNSKPDVERYGLPFELDVQGLGQVNP